MRRARSWAISRGGGCHDQGDLRTAQRSPQRCGDTYEGMLTHGNLTVQRDALRVVPEPGDVT